MADSNNTAKKKVADPEPAPAQLYRSAYYPAYPSVYGSRYYPYTSYAYPYPSYAYPYPSYAYPQRTVVPPVKQTQTYSEYIPVKKSYIEQVPETYVRYTPVEHEYTDYVEVKHEIDYVPVPRVEYDYVPQERSYVAGEVPGGLVGSRVLTSPYDYTTLPGVRTSTYIPATPSVYRPRSTTPLYTTRAPGYYSTYASPYKYL